MMTSPRWTATGKLDPLLNGGLIRIRDALSLEREAVLPRCNRFMSQKRSSRPDDAKHPTIRCRWRFSARCSWPTSWRGTG
jgi:hypothetical protein